ncbi:type II secretion system GspH family protein [Candidatus Parcubacteria bacterium]|nr:type II secretion system GspH family protein [Candidatus Parcubacteria bacterium]
MFTRYFSTKKQRGTSLVEIIIVIFLVSILFELCFMEAKALGISHKQRYEDIAYHVANKEMETLRSTAFDSLPGSGTISDPMLAQIPSGAGDFTVADYPGYTNLKKLTVTVNWNDGANKSVVLTTLAGGGGINP